MGKKLVLIVDDNDVNCMVADNMLRIIGFDTKVAKSGKEAIELADQFEFNIILMDWQMPELNGFDTASLIWGSSKKNSATPMLAVTANAFQEDRSKCIAHGFKGVLTKPFDVDQLEQIVNTHIRG